MKKNESSKEPGKSAVTDHRLMCALSEQDMQTVRQLYGEVQNWTRHYEQLIVNANVLIISACLIFVGLAFGDGVRPRESFILLAIPAVIAVVGIVMTQTLFNLYALCIRRLIRLESLLGCFDEERMQKIDGEGSLVPMELKALPVRRPTSVRFFLGLFAIILLSIVALGILKFF